MPRFPLTVAVAFVAIAVPAHAETVNAAVAANFTAVSEEIAALFEDESGHTVELSFASTGQLFAQISQGAPFHVFLAADQERPARAVADGHAVEGSAFTYAAGSLVLYSTSIDVSAGPGVLEGNFAHLAIADPVAAPYGAAAVETMEALGLYEALEPKLVTGANISQTLQFIESDNAELGFVAASQVIGKDYRWLVPADLHEPIAQDAVLLTYGAENPAASAFLAFLRSDTAFPVIEAAGYTVP